MVKYSELPSILAAQYTKIERIVIKESGESLEEISLSIPRFEPHAYQALGAPYGKDSPFSVRQSVAAKILKANDSLRPFGLSLKIFDAYRPLRVQQFMVDSRFQELRGRSELSHLTDEEISREVLNGWASPNPDPLQPPPHSTGGVVDLTIVRDDGRLLDMGSAIDEFGPTQLPDYFATLDSTVHANRELLCTTMESVGFARLLHEWWHFSYGDRYWAYLQSTRTGNQVDACYGRAGE